MFDAWNPSKLEHNNLSVTGLAKNFLWFLSENTGLAKKLVWIFLLRFYGKAWMNFLAKPIKDTFFVFTKNFMNNVITVLFHCCCSVTQLCPTLCNPVDCSTPGFVDLYHPWSMLKLHPDISFSAVPFSFCLQSFPASESFLISQLFASGCQSIGASASVLPVNIQSWFPLGFTGWPCSPMDSQDSSPVPQFKDTQLF